MKSPTGEELICPACGHSVFSSWPNFLWHMHVHLVGDITKPNQNFYRFKDAVEEGEMMYQKACQFYYDSLLGVSNEEETKSKRQ